MTNSELRQLLKKHNLNGNQLAKALNMPRQQVYTWLNYGANRKCRQCKIGKAWQIILTQYFDKFVT